MFGETGLLSTLDELSWTSSVHLYLNYIDFLFQRFTIDIYIFEFHEKSDLLSDLFLIIVGGKNQFRVRTCAGNLRDSSFLNMTLDILDREPTP